MEKQIDIYQHIDGQTQIEFKFEQDTVWLSQDQRANLFNQTISLHINNCYNEGELVKKAIVKNSLTVQEEGKRKVERKINYYNLDAIISVGYRLNSKRVGQFQQWATQRLKDFLVRGHAID